MKKLVCLFASLALVAVACNDNSGDENLESGLGEVIPGMEIKQVTGTVIGMYHNGFGSLVVQVDEDFPIGKSLDIYPGGYFRSSIRNDTDEIVTYPNAIQVQWNLPLGNVEKVSFSVREFLKNKDSDLFVFGSGIMLMDSTWPDVPIYVVTDFKPLND